MVRISAPPRTLFGPRPRTMRPSSSSSASTPQALRPSTISVMRSLSFTRNSAAPVMRVSPSANAAATARIGNSSIIAGARLAGGETPLNSLARTTRLAIGSPIGSRLSSNESFAPISSSVSYKPSRSGLISTSSITTSDLPQIKAAAAGNAAEEGSAGTYTGAAFNLLARTRGCRAPSISTWSMFAPNTPSIRSV